MQACYDPRYLPASFKGFRFEAMTADSDHGRRGAEGEFPFGENTAYADLGRRIRHYKLKARFPTNDHIQQANRFIAVCESPGPGTLVHPTRGVVKAACKTIKVNDDLFEGGGVSYAELEFVEANDWVSGFALGATSILGINITPILTAAATFFSASYRPQDVPFYQSQELRSAAFDALAGIAAALDQATVGKPSRDGWRISADLKQAAVDASPTSKETFAAVATGLAAIDALAASAKARYDALRAVINLGTRRITLSGAGGASQEALIALLRMLGGAYLARSAMETAPTTLQEGFKQYDVVVSVFDQELAAARATCDDDRYLALQATATDARVLLLNRAYNLPPVVEYDFAGGVHALVAAHEIYGDGKRHRDIERQNPQMLAYAMGDRVVAVRA